MAMNSINMPLFTIGLDAVWYNTLLRFNFTDKEARAFLAGPGHAAWQWMQNLQSYGGPLPKTVIDKHAALGKKLFHGSWSWECNLFSRASPVTYLVS